jgi:putative nucleotidyltransferase with HDIG domain
MTEIQQETSGKNYLFAISHNEQHLSQIKNAAHSFYRTRTYEDPSQLLEVLEKNVPSALIVDARLKGMSGYDFVAKIRTFLNADQLAIVYTPSSSQVETQDLEKEFSGIHILEKPYRRTELLHAISSQVNAKIESDWDTIEPVQQAALKNTLASFNSIADLISEGDPVAYENVSASCAPLLQAVQDQNYKELLKGVRGHDNYSYVHSMRVATLLSLFGAAIGIKGDDHMTLTAGGLLHDVGKMVIPHEVLNKAGKLDEGEFTVMKSHVTHTLDFLEKTEMLPKGVIIIAGQHHEKIDGTGYPYGLSGTKLNQLGRMASIIDVFSALTDRRVYKPPMEPEKALAIMTSMTGHLDQGLTTIFKEMLLDSADMF